MGKRTKDLDAFSGTLASSYRLAIDNPGWTEALYITLSQLQSFITSHNAVTLANPANGLGLTDQVLSLSVFGANPGACPAQPASPHGGLVLNAIGGWTQLYSIADPGGLAIEIITPPSESGGFGVGTGKFYFGVSEALELGTASLYSDTAGEIKTDELITATLGFKPGTGSTLLEIGAESTETLVATGDYLPLSIKEGGVDKIVYIPTYAAAP